MFKEISSNKESVIYLMRVVHTTRAIKNDLHLDIVTAFLWDNFFFNRINIRFIFINY